MYDGGSRRSSTNYPLDVIGRTDTKILEKGLTTKEKPARIRCLNKGPGWPR